MATNQPTDRAARLGRLRPGSQIEILLATIAEQNEEIIALLGGGAKPQGDEVALREPAKARHRDAKQAEERAGKADKDAPEAETDKPTPKVPKMS